MNIKNKEELLLRISRYLMLQGSFTNNLGLLNGKMGFSLFFFHYSRFREISLYEDFAEELITEIYREITQNVIYNFRDGLCGIAWGIEYLIRNKFVEAEEDDILKELDNKILEYDIRYMKDFSLETGLVGIGHYAISRCIGATKGSFPLPKTYLNELVHSLITTNDETSKKLGNYLSQIVQKTGSPYTDDVLYQLLLSVKYNDNSIFNKNRPIGILNSGYTGIGLKLMLSNHGKNQNIHI
ncbi:MAG: hypothetical protein GX416_04585 [Bacteroidales bacterium]|nr:hypothetical protein [Bacteroidales bacterium]